MTLKASLQAGPPGLKNRGCESDRDPQRKRDISDVDYTGHFVKFIK